MLNRAHYYHFIIAYTTQPANAHASSYFRIIFYTFLVRNNVFRFGLSSHMRNGYRVQTYFALALNWDRNCFHSICGNSVSDATNMSTTFVLMPIAAYHPEPSTETRIIHSIF